MCEEMKKSWIIMLLPSVVVIIIFVVLIAIQRADFKDSRDKYIQIYGCIDIMHGSKFEGREFPELKIDCEQVLADWEKEREAEKETRIKKFVDTFRKER